MQQGKIKFFNAEKLGYKGINIGTKVTYDAESNKKGKTQATNIQIIG